MDTFKGKWDNFGATEHNLTRHGQQFNWILPKAIARESDFRKDSKKKIKAINGDEGNLIKLRSGQHYSPI